ncbi:CocE/NonD hydrolase [Candidatus Magnetomorum sp. HK-1]|nr:CocE/NonD hydrolase [Candidatus Magnetomorum sp. HK-1]
MKFYLKRLTILSLSLFLLLAICPFVAFTMDLSTTIEDQMRENFKTVITGDYILELNERIPVSKSPYQPTDPPETINLMATVVRHVDNEPRPTILIATPYRRWVFIAQGIYLFNHGYNVVAVDIRGTGSSEGTFLFAAPEEHYDIAYVVDKWIPSQSWSDGKVGMIGHSYNGVIQLLAAGHIEVDENTGEPVHLKALLPMQPYNNSYDEGMHGGIPEFGFMSFWAGLHTFLSFMPPILYMGDLGSQLPTYNDFKDSSEMWLRNILDTPMEYKTWWFGSDQEIIDDWYFSASPILYWPDKPQGGWDLPEGLGQTIIPEKLPVLIVAGWYDIFTNGSIEYYEHGLSRHADEDKALVIGPWYHANGVFDPYFINIMMKIAPRWFDWKIKGIEDDFLAEYSVLLFATGEGKWRAEKSWPLPESRTEKKTYYMSKQKAPLDITDWFSVQNLLNNYKLKETFTSKDYEWKANPVLLHDPLLTHGLKSRAYVRWFPFGVPALPAYYSRFILGKNIDSTMPYEDERLDELGVLTFTTGKLEKDVEIVGPLKLTFWAKTSFPLPLTDALKVSAINLMNKFYLLDETNLLLDSMAKKDVQWVVEVNDVFPSGRAKNITSGWLSAWHRPYDPNEASDATDHKIDPNYVPFDPFYFMPHKNPKPIKEDHIYPYVVEIWPTANVFKAGHRIRVSISASDFPHLLPIMRTIKNTIIINENYQATLDFSTTNGNDEGKTWKWVENIFEYTHKAKEPEKTGSISGTIKTNFAGQNDIKVANALIALENTNITAVTDALGNFSLTDVPIGDYKLNITAQNLNPIARMIKVKEDTMQTLSDLPEMKIESITDKLFSEDELSKFIKEAILQERFKWDIHSDNKKGIPEAIDALQNAIYQND